MLRLLRAFGSIGFVCLFVSGAMGCKHVCTKNPYPCEKSPVVAATPSPTPCPTAVCDKGCPTKTCLKETPCTVCQKPNVAGQPCTTCNAPLGKLPGEGVAEDLKIPFGGQPKTETAQTENPVSPRDPRAPENLPFPRGFDAPYPLDVPIKGLGDTAKNTATLKNAEPLPAQSSTKGYASNYSWLIGEVQYSHISKEWRIRYLGVDQTDDIGGSVTLQGADQWLDEINKGGLFRITGQMHKLEKGYVYEVISVKRAN